MKSFSFLCILLVTIGCKPEQSFIVKTDKGTVEGFEKGDIDIFKGIPFAAPPVGDLRWKAPQEHEPWDGVLQTKEFSASPIQSKPKPFKMWSAEFISPPEPLSEDCLYLNIWSKKTKEKKPVFVWIYGGGFNSGSAGCAIYDGEEYAKNDVVFVSINYRVNMFGYLAHPELSSENDEGISGNYGLLDQIQALKWVQDNIEAFGGDPNNVTVAGQSAGSMSVHSLVASPLAKGLFHKAIGQSGGFLGGNRAVTLEEAELKGKELFDKLDGKSMQELREVPAEELFEMVNNVGYTSYAPVRDGVVLANDLEGSFKSGQFNDVPFLGGWVSGDGKLFSAPEISPEEYQKEIVKEFGDKSGDYLALFPGNNSDELQASIGKKNMLSFAGLPVHLLAKYNSKPVYVYEISHVPVEKPDFPDYGAFHTSDVPLTLHNLHTWDRPWRDIDRNAETLISSYWLNFIKTGNPNGEGLPEWNVYDDGGIQLINASTSSEPDLYQAELEILSK
ncbi:carboxylesterase/lipase family protein [Arcticibacterium luteifluviistationis]|uniref:Carboxylic ester hydrolase n=1 Tax=Arcticibacterium luteifluviistationis TaxID=1784714 RepID=A0A2Z4GCR6_9BACT|nr:carboxylesterase family protein [Arcticibacterium luteifluviistationis]AWV99026.1 esterase [Arcticibacterium luteifluviistationis]